MLNMAAGTVLVYIARFAQLNAHFDKKLAGFGVDICGFKLSDFVSLLNVGLCTLKFYGGGVRRWSTQLKI